MIIIEKLAGAVGQDYSAYIVMLVSNIIWTIALMGGAEIEYGNVFYIGIIRGVVTVVSAYAIAKALGYRLDFKNRGDMKIILIRAFITGLQQIVTIFAFYYLPPSLVYTITSIGPIIVFVIDYFKNHISVTSRQVLGVVVSSFGLIIAVNSLIIMHWLGYESFTDHSKYKYIQSTIGFKIIVCLILFGEFILWAYAMVITKDLKETNPVQLSFGSGFIFCWMACICYLPYQNTRVITFNELVFDMIFVGGLLALSTYLYMIGLTLSKKTGNLTITNFSTVVIGYIISVVRYGETPNLIGIFGSAFIFVGLILVLIKKQTEVKV